MSVEAVDEQGQSASVLKRPFISDSIRDIPFYVSVYSPSSDAVFYLQYFFSLFITTFISL